MNTCILSLEGLYKAGGETDVYLSTMNLVFTLIFILEMLAKIAALGPAGYVSDRMNIFDCLIVLLSFLEIIQLIMTGKIT